MERSIRIATRLAAAAVLLCAGISHAEPFRIGVRGGLSIPNLSGGTTEISKGYMSRLAPDLSLVGELGLTEHFSLQLEIDYAGQGAKRDGLQPVTNLPPELQVPPGTTLYADFQSEAVLNYLEIPLMAKLSWGKEWRLFGELGVFMGWLLNATQETSGTSQLFVDKNRTPLALPPSNEPLPPVSFDASTDIKDEIETFNVGLVGGVGLGRNFGPHEVYLDLRGEYGFINIQKDPVNGQNHTGRGVVSLGYNYKL